MIRVASASDVELNPNLECPYLNPMVKLFQARPRPGFDSLPLTPLSAGDLIDLALRIYRREAFPLIRIVLLPGLVSYAGVILFSIGFNNFSTMRGDERVLITAALIAAGALLYLIGKILFYALLGGASRSLFDHVMGRAGADGQGAGSDRPFRVGEVYRAVRGRPGAMLGAILLLILLGVVALTILYLVLAALAVGYVAIHITFLKVLPLSIQIICGSLVGLLLFGGLLWCGLLLSRRLVCVPQILLVEERGVFAAIGRSFALGGRGVSQMGALLLFWFFTDWSIWFLLILPVAWYGYLEGIEINPFSAEGPLWYLITQQTLSQLSQIVVAPVALVGFALLYLDTRIRMEGFDVELLAQRILSPPSRDAAHPQGGREP